MTAPRRTKGESLNVDFPSLAEAERRVGRIAEAERIAREGLEECPDSLPGRIALALALLDAGRSDEARRELEGGLGSVPDPSVDAIEDGELEAAFEHAVPDPEETVDADRIAQEAMRAANLERPEGLVGGENSPFATRTLAALLEQQGDADGARRVRAAVEDRASPERADQVIATLERWLENLRRGRA